MLRDDVERIQSCQQQLREQLQRLPVPLMAIEGDEDGQVIVGNEAAFIRLAIDSMDVASGQNVGFDPAIAGKDSQGPLLGMRYDPDPTVPITREQPWWGKIVGAFILGAIGIVFATGVIVDITWTVRQIAAIFAH